MLKVLKKEERDAVMGAASSKREIILNTSERREYRHLRKSKVHTKGEPQNPDFIYKQLCIHSYMFKL